VYGLAVAKEITMAHSSPESLSALRVMCARALMEVANAVGRAFTAGAGPKVDFIFGTVGVLQARLDAGEAADVLVLSAPLIARLDQAGLLLADSSQTIGSTGIVVAVREGAPRPDIAAEGSFKAALVNARSIAFSDPAVGGSAGVYLAGLFERMDLADVIKRKGLPQQSGGEVARRVAEGVAEIGMTQHSEMLAVNGVSVVGPLPAGLRNDTIYRAAVHARSSNAHAARDFIAMLIAPETRELLAAAGLDPPPAR
jgi:molybdate transport system substrate-binding protein